jgi:hypothetical protein
VALDASRHPFTRPLTGGATLVPTAFQRLRERVAFSICGKLLNYLR